MVGLHGSLEAEVAQRGLGKGDALEAVVVVAIDRLPLHPLDLAVDRVGDDLVVAAQALLVSLELDVAAMREVARNGVRNTSLLLGEAAAPLRVFGSLLAVFVNKYSQFSGRVSSIFLRIFN